MGRSVTRCPAFALAVLVLTLMAASGCGGPMQAGELAPSVDTLASSAAEGRLIAHGVSTDRTKTTFVRVRAQELGETVDHESEKLSDATAAAGVGRDKARASALADSISTALGQIQTSPDDPRVARKAEAQLGVLAARAERLAGSL